MTAKNNKKEENKLNAPLLVTMAVGLIIMNIYWAFFEKKAIQFEDAFEKSIFVSLKFTGNQSKYHTFVGYAYDGDEQKQLQIHPTNTTYNLVSGYRSKKPECFKITEKTLKNKDGGPEKKIKYILSDFTRQPIEFCKAIGAKRI
jgi:hypothetical protein